MDENQNFYRIKKAIEHLLKNFKNQPTLEELADSVNMSKFYFQRTFQSWAGITPKQFLSYLTVKALKQEILNTNNLIEASENVGLSSQSRAYDLMVNIESVTPGEYKTSGKSITISYGFVESPFGACFVATTSRGVCSFQFVEDKQSVITEFEHEWKNASFIRDDSVAERVVNDVFSPNGTKKINLHLKGTPFQIQVWQALLSIPFGSVASYGSVAKLASNDNGTRAVASAIARNPIGYIIPCHRVIRNEGIVGEYHWSSERKAMIIGWEKAMLNNRPNKPSPIVVIFEVKPTDEGKETYLKMAKMLKLELEKADGFISGERYESLAEEGKLLSVNMWRDEESLNVWRNNIVHRMNQKIGHDDLFEKYNIKVLSVIRDYSMTDRSQAPADSNEYILKPKG